LDLLDSFGVSAGKGERLDLVRHPGAVANLLLLPDGLMEVFDHAVRARQYGARCLLFLGYKRGHVPFFSATCEVVGASSMLTTPGGQAGITIAADDHTRRRFGLAVT
jgi:hypothetical protein